MGPSPRLQIDLISPCGEYLGRDRESALGGYPPLAPVTARRAGDTA